MTKRIPLLWIPILALILCSMLFAALSPRAVFAAQNMYTDVLDDLSVDGSFNIEQYPSVPDNHALHVIQVAESNADELFVYVYQPGGDVATSINISTSINDSLSYKNYKLTLLNARGALAKYRVQDFVVLPDALRYYDISSIYRRYDAAIDDPADNDNTINEVAYEVARRYTASTVAGSVSYTCLQTEVITITDKWCGFLRYDNGFHLSYSACDSWFIAFDTDRRIDKLMEADVYYVSQSYAWQHALGSKPYEQYGDPVDNYASLTYEDEAGNPADGWFAKKYTWKRIESAADFINKEDLTDDAKAALSGKKWVLRFAETSYTLYGSINATTEYSTKISEVTILRLKFETNGITYNLGVVDNKQTADDVPDNNQDKLNWELWGDQEIPWWVWMLIGIAVLIVLLVLLSSGLLDQILYCLIWIVTLPFRLLYQLFHWILSGILKVDRKNNKRSNNHGKKKRHQ